MSEETKDKNNINSTIDAITGLAKAIPVYDDAIKPAAKEVGKSLATVAKTINIALTPISGLVWGYEKIKDFVLKRISEKLENIPEEKIVTPDPAIVGPSLEALRYTGNDVNLRELYATLIATSMNSDTLKNAHPGFVEIIKNLSSDEALIIHFFYTNLTGQQAMLDINIRAKNNPGEHNVMRNLSLIGEKSKIKNKDLINSYLDNLCRLGLLEIPPNRRLMDDKLYEEIKENSPYKYTENEHVEIIYAQKYIQLTDWGRQFCNSCITN